MLINKNVLTINENGRRLSFFSMVFSKAFETLFVNIFSAVTSVMLSGYSEVAVSVASLSNQIINLLLMFLDMATIGAVIHMSASMGGNNRKRAGEFSSTAVFTAGVVSVITSIVLFMLARLVMVYMNAETEILDAAVQYLKIRAIFLPVTVMMRCFNNFLICNGYSSYTLVSGVLYNVVNAFLCYEVLYGYKAMPISPISGVAIGNGIACLCGLVFSAGIYRWKKCPFAFCFKKQNLTGILKLGVPGGMNNFNYNMAQTVTTALIASLGISVFNTKVYISSIIVFSSVLSYAIGQAGAVFTGRYRGRGDFESINQLYKQNLLMAICANVVVSTTIFLFHKPLVGMFTNDSGVIAAAGKIMLIDIAVQIFRAINQVNDQALNANGDVKTTFTVSVVACWSGSVFLAWLFGVKLGFGLFGIWMAFLIDEAFKTTVYVIRWRKGKWKTIKI